MPVIPRNSIKKYSEYLKNKYHLPSWHSVMHFSIALDFLCFFNTNRNPMLNIKSNSEAMSPIFKISNIHPSKIIRSKDEKH
jgi:hypothetical protein